MQIIEEFRRSGQKELLDKYRFKHNGETEYGKINDFNLQNRIDLVLELFRNYSIKDKPLIRWILKQEIRCANKISISIASLELCAFMLYKVMTLEDIYLLYKAKFGNTYDNSFELDVELIFGFDRELTKQFLKNTETKKKKSKVILKMIKGYEKRCKDNPEAFKSRTEYINYFENRKSINLIRELRACLEHLLNEN
ncbi:hypothetical protein [Flammeovirga sp. SJP92]|uniref:hypothetical protein n=1 Tax=Flammeovirga sp. SJP92 TaxID=1775430 RepID=UPI0007895BF8|nr:hypothetical protein [Flammeovirga sp. SJP92]KXX69365.1 hypothetical protein AVL50_19420 [Flammeovirga sp. SJP92]